MITRLIAAVSALAIASLPAAAQSLNQMMNMMLNAAQMDQQRQQAREAWARVEPGVVQCLQEKFGAYPAQLSENGIGPGDSRIVPYIGRCLQALARLKQQERAREAWAKVEPAVIACLESVPERRPQLLAERGIAPDDPRIAADIGRCTQAAALRQRAQEAWAQVEPAVVRCVERNLRPADELAERGLGPGTPAVALFVNRCRQEQHFEEQRRKAQAEANAKAAAAARLERESALRLRSDPALVRLLGPAARDVTVLVAAKDTANVMRNLEGRPVFTRLPVACAPFGEATAGRGPDEAAFAAAVKSGIEKKGGAGVRMTSCAAERLAEYDLVLFSAAQVAGGAAATLAPLVEAIKRGALVEFALFTVTAFEEGEQAKRAAADAEAQRREGERQLARDGLAAREGTLVSAVILRAPAQVVCLGPSADGEGLRYLLGRGDSPFADAVSATSVLRELATSDAIFIALKRRDCAAAVAPAAMLREIVAALDRDGVRLEVEKGYLEAEQLAQWHELAAREPAPAPARAQAAAEPALPAVPPAPPAKPESEEPPPAAAEESENADATHVLVQAELIRRIERGTVLVLTEASTGSGFFIKPTIVVTNRHVVARARSGRVLVTSKSLGRVVGGRVVAATANNGVGEPDFALVEVAPGSGAEPLSLSESVGKLLAIVAAGYPGLAIENDVGFRRLLGGDPTAAPDLSVNDGKISAIQNSPSGTRRFLHSAEVLGGNSGGPLIDNCGRVVGVNTFIAVDREQSGRISYALSTHDLLAFLKRKGIAIASEEAPCQ